jgi:hypothetical protein
MTHIWGWLDTAAYARGGGYNSCHYNCGWNMLSGLAIIVLIGVCCALIKYAWMERRFVPGILAFVLCGGLLVGVAFVGPVVMVVGTVAMVALLLSWMWREKKA